MAVFYLLPYAVFFLKILSCLTQHTTYELGNGYVSEESDVDVSNVFYNPWNEIDNENFDDIIFDDDSYEHESVNNINPILTRVRRRIFPGVGKALDRDRSQRNPWVRTREGQTDQTDNTQVLKRNGPMGSDLLYELYPELAPSDWIDPSKRTNNYVEPLQIENLTDGEPDDEELEVEEMDQNPKEKHSFKIERDVGSRNMEKRRRQKVRIPKKLKEEIAIFAVEHGSSAAVAYFSTRVNFPLKKGAVEKFVRRYRRRKERQRKRRLSRRS